MFLTSVSQLGHYWHLGQGSSLLCRTVLCIVGHLASLAPSTKMSIVPTPHLHHCDNKSSLTGTSLPAKFSYENHWDASWKTFFLYWKHLLNTACYQDSWKYIKSDFLECLSTSRKFDTWCVVRELFHSHI